MDLEQGSSFGSRRPELGRDNGGRGKLRKALRTLISHEGEVKDDVIVSDLR